MEPIEHVVGEADTAQALGSGDLPVLGTPRLLAWAEHATCVALAPALQPGQTSVGTRVELDHVRPSAVGARLRVRAELVHADGRLRRLRVAVTDADDRLVGEGQVTRVVVDADRFLQRLTPAG